jgi:hypothetical protein
VTLQGEQERLGNEGMVRLTVLDSLTLQTGDYGTPATGIQAMSFAAKAAIAIVAIALLAGAATFAVYIHLERQKDRMERPYIQRDKKNGSNRTLGCEESSQVSETVGLRNGTAVVLEGGRPVVIEFEKNFKRPRDAIEEKRSECGSTAQSKGSGSRSSRSKGSASRSTSRSSGSTSRSRASASPQYVPKGLCGTGEESKIDELERFQTLGGSLRSIDIQPADPMSIASASEYVVSEYTEYTDQTASSGQVRNGEFT